MYVIAGDFNCDSGTRFYTYFQNVIADNMSDSCSSICF